MAKKASIRVAKRGAKGKAPPSKPKKTDVKKGKQTATENAVFRCVRGGIFGDRNMGRQARRLLRG
jgi:hypothetical protein